MTSLSDLTDVGDLSGASNDDYLAYDNASSLWVPRTPPASGGSWVANTGTLTYPAGDNGWVYVSDDRSAPIEARHIESTATVPAANAALIHDFTVTSAMVAVAGTSGLDHPINVGLQVNLSGTVANQSGLITWRTALVIGGTTRHYIGGTVANGTSRTTRTMMCPVAVDDTVEIHSWITNSNADGIDVELTLAAPIVQGFNAYPDTQDGDVLLFWSDVDPSQSALATAPSGVDMDPVGDTSWDVRYNLQRGNAAGEIATFVSTVSLTAGLWSLRLPYSGATDGLGQPWVREGRTSSSSAAGDPLLYRCPRFTVFDFYTWQTDLPAAP